MDIDVIALDADYVKAIEKTVGECDVLIAVIGKDWATSCDQEGQRRLDNPEDFVRLEIATALKRNVRIIPVLVDGALMPRSSDLPDDLKSLVRRNALEVSHNRFDADCRRLVAAIEQVLEKTAPEHRERKKKEQDEVWRIWVEDSHRQKEDKERLEEEQDRPAHDELTDDVAVPISKPATVQTDPLTQSSLKQMPVQKAWPRMTRLTYTRSCYSCTAFGTLPSGSKRYRRFWNEYPIHTLY